MDRELKRSTEQLLLEFYERLPIPLHRRNMKIVELPKKISTILGMRRIGKSHLLYQRINELLETGVTREQIYYLNLEDDRLPEFDKGTLGELIDGFYELYPQNHQRHCYLFLDEVQNAPDWSKLMRRLHDTKDVSLYLSGSSARLLSKEIATELRGRAISTEVWPYSLSEFLQASHLPKVAAGPMSPRARDEYLALLRDYLLKGGFPEPIDYSEIDRRRVHQDYVSVTILRDILERHEVKNEHLVRYLIKFALGNTGKLITFNKLFHDLQSQGYKIGKSTIYEYFGYITDCYLIALIPLYSESRRKQESNPRKVYAVDTGLARSHMIGITQNLGRLFETLVYLDLRRHGCEEVYYYTTESGKEVDFIAHGFDGRLHLMQVCYDIQEKDTFQREQNALNEAEKELGVKGLIVTRENYLDFLASFETNDHS
ncbi:MAG TPA: ATP-binding protein [Chlamydiales bacterium]|nr:ATP-binding protein [Chlamydiales bacterium]